MGRKYRQGRKIFWATLALLLLLVAVPLSIGVTEWWNEKVAGTEAVAYELNNKTTTTGYITGTASGVAGAVIYTSDGIFTAALTPFYGVQHNNESNWNELFIQTGATGTDNTTTTNFIILNMNISAQKLIQSNANKIHIIAEGLNNYNATLYIKIKNAHTFFADSGAYSIDNGAEGWHAIKTYEIHNNTLDITYTLDPAVLSYIASKTNDSYMMSITLKSKDNTKEIFSEGQTIFYKVQILHPHGRLTFSSYDWTEIVLAFWSGVGLVVLMVTSPMWNPTTHNGFIEKMIQHRRYSRSSRNRRTRRSGSHRRTHRTNRRRR